MVKVSQRSDELRIYRVEKGERGNFGKKGSTMQDVKRLKEYVFRYL